MFICFLWIEFTFDIFIDWTCLDKVDFFGLGVHQELNKNILCGFFDHHNNLFNSSITFNLDGLHGAFSVSVFDLLDNILQLWLILDNSIDSSPWNLDNLNFRFRNDSSFNSRELFLVNNGDLSSLDVDSSGYLNGLLLAGIDSSLPINLSSWFSRFDTSSSATLDLRNFSNDCRSDNSSFFGNCFLASSDYSFFSCFSIDLFSKRWFWDRLCLSCLALRSFDLNNRWFSFRINWYCDNLGASFLVLDFSSVDSVEEVVFFSNGNDLNLFKTLNCWIFNCVRYKCTSLTSKLNRSSFYNILFSFLFLSSLFCFSLNNRLSFPDSLNIDLGTFLNNYNFVGFAWDDNCDFVFSGSFLFNNLHSLNGFW